MKNFLIDEERASLTKQHKKEREGRVRDPFLMKDATG